MSIERYSEIKPDELDGADYFSSLVAKAGEKGLITAAELERLQQSTLSLLSYVTRRYTAFDSTSVTADRAQSLLDSALFTAGLELKGRPTPDEALEALLQEDLLTLFRAGRGRIDSLMSRARDYQAAILSSLFPTKNEFYSATLIGGISGFFKLYRPDYAAQEIHITADYPTLVPMPRLKGIEFICRYLRCLYIENAFLCLFDPELVHRLLCAHEPHYEHIPLNLCRPVLCSALGCELLGRSPQGLGLSFDDLGVLSECFKGLDKYETASELEAALTALSADMKLPRQLSAYLRAALPDIAALIACTDSAALGSIFSII